MKQSRFAAIRDQIALSGMIERKESLEVLSAGIWKKIKRLRNELKKYPKPPGGIDYNMPSDQVLAKVRILATREKINTELDEVFKAWALVEMEIGNIERDPRYKALQTEENRLE